MKGENEELLTRQLAINETNFSMPGLDCPLNPIRKIGNIGKIDENRLKFEHRHFRARNRFFFQRDQTIYRRPETSENNPFSGSLWPDLILIAPKEITPSLRV